MRILTLPFDPTLGGFDDGPLVDVLRGKQLQRIEPHFFQQDGRSFWTLLVEYTPVLDDPPVRARDAQVLSETERRLLDELRAWRKETAQQLGLPVYVVATNRQLLDLVLFARTKDEVRQWRRAIERYLGERLRLSLNCGSTWINRTSHGLSFLGHRIFPNLIRACSENRRRSLRKLALRHRQWLANQLTDEQWQACLTSLTGYQRYFSGVGPLLVPPCDGGDTGGG